MSELFFVAFVTLFIVLVIVCKILRNFVRMLCVCMYMFICKYEGGIVCKKILVYV